MTLTNDEFCAARAQQHRDDLRAARSFAMACAAGDVAAMLYAANCLSSETFDGWRHAMRMVGRIGDVSADVRAAFLNVWIEHKGLPLRVGHRPTMVAALRVMMPRTHALAPLKIYRGAGAHERRHHQYGFSWTTRLDVAKEFAAKGVSIRDAVVLETLAPPAAIFLVREDEGYYDEGEVVVDPFALGPVRVAERFSATGHTNQQGCG